MSDDDTVNVILRSVERGGMTAESAADLLGKLSANATAAQPEPAQEAPAESVPPTSTPAEQQEQAAQRFLAELQAARSSGVSIPMTDWL